MKASSAAVLFVTGLSFAQGGYAKVSGPNPAASQRVEMKQADNLVQRKINKDIKSNSAIQADTKNSLDVKVIGNTIYLDGPVSSAAEKAVIMQIVAKQGPRYKVTDTTVTK